MIHFGRALGLRSLGSSESSSRQTAWKMSVASSGEKPYLMGIEKIRFLYLSISADQAASLPFRHSRTSRVSVHAICCSSLANAFRRTRGTRIHGHSVDVQLFHVPQSVRIQNRRMEIPDPILGSNQNVRARHANYWQILRHNFLHLLV